MQIVHNLMYDLAYQSFLKDVYNNAHGLQSKGRVGSSSWEAHQKLGSLTHITNAFALVLQVGHTNGRHKHLMVQLTAPGQLLVILFDDAS